MINKTKTEMTGFNAASDEGAAPSDADNYRGRPQDEMLPFLNNFHDIFTTIGILILSGGLALGVGQIINGLGAEAGSTSWQLTVIALIAGVAVVYWLISAVIVGRQRRILPGIALSLGFAVSAGLALGWLYFLFVTEVAGVSGETFEAAFGNIEGGEPNRDVFMSAVGALPWQVRIAPIAFGLAGLLPIGLYYLTYRLPFSGGLTGVALVGLAVLTLMTVDPYTTLVYNPTVSVAAGLALFLAGVFFDMRDPGRTTRLSGTGFWLHFFAAPALLGSVLGVTQTGWSLGLDDFNNRVTPFFMGEEMANEQAVSIAVVTLTVIGIFALISLLINRRALIVSGLLWAGVSIGVLVNQLGLGVGAVAAVTLLALGAVVVILGAAWNPLRGILVAPFPSRGPLARLFPPVGQPG